MIHYKIMRILVINSHITYTSDEYNPTDTKPSHLVAASINQLKQCKTAYIIWECSLKANTSQGTRMYIYYMYVNLCMSMCAVNCLLF